MYAIEILIIKIQTKNNNNLFHAFHIKIFLNILFENLICVPDHSKGCIYLTNWK